MIDVNPEYEETDELKQLDPSFHAMFVAMQEIFSALGDPKDKSIELPFERHN